ncbi:DUF3011 domain-containing protein [Dokdonella sp.]|uniref:DUF3011 domain-containing protein n=1 Tax=Dokdonella sp. TaxID=2291710 RepID=UPI0025BB1DFB|nr:DUF3011 domain-containing protein [Dokdonella sp.]
MKFLMAISLAAAAFFAASAVQAQPGQWYPGPDWDRDINVRCASHDYRYRMCQIDTGRGSRVYLTRQISNTRCIEGRNWGWNRAGVWVDGGCEGIFTVERRWSGGPGRPPGHGGPGGWVPGPDWDNDISVRCGSRDYRYNLCQVDTGRGGRVYITRQISNTRCVEGRTWGWNRAGIWVDGGCEAIFTVERRWR